MKKSCVSLFATAIIGIGLAIAIPTSVHANPNELQIEINKTQQELLEVNQQIERLDEAIIDNQKQIADTEEKIHNAQTELDQLEAEKQVILDRMEKREELIKDRLRFLQKNGGNIGYLEVLFNSANFEDFISRAFTIATITKSDLDLIAEQRKDAKILEEKEEVVQTVLNDLRDMKIELNGMQSQIAEQKTLTEAIKADFEEKLQRLTAEQRAQLEAARLERIAMYEAEQAAGGADGSTTEGATEGVSGDITDTSTPVASVPTASGNEAIQIVTTVGNKYIGNSVYVYAGGRTPYDVANGRFDCSGFVSWAFAQAGISVSPSTAGLSGQGTKVSTSEMRPGDIVFFNTYKTNGHVGIYLGDGKFIGSQNSTGVAIASMNDSYWANRFTGHVRRIIH